MHILNKVPHAVIARSALFLCFFAALSAHATSMTLPYSFTAGGPISASQMMGNFASITSALSSTVSSPWVASSSNIYFNAGAVGIGSSAPANALDVSGNVAVSGKITAGNVGFKIITLSGQHGSTVNSWTTYNLPSGVTLSNVISMTGITNYWTGASNVRFSAFDTRDPCGYWNFYLSTNAPQVQVNIGSGATGLVNQTFTITFIVAA